MGFVHVLLILLNSSQYLLPRTTLRLTKTKHPGHNLQINKGVVNVALKGGQTRTLYRRSGMMAVTLLQSNQKEAMFLIMKRVFFGGTPSPKLKRSCFSEEVMVKQVLAENRC